jgi:hypothetical protein
MVSIKFIYQPNTNHWAGIGKLPALVSWYSWYILVGITFLAMVGIFRLVLLCKPFLPSLSFSVGRNFFCRFRGTLFLKKSAGSHSKREPKPPSLREKGAPAKFVIPTFTNQVFGWYQLVKYRQNTTTSTNQKYEPSIQH